MVAEGKVRQRRQGFPDFLVTAESGQCLSLEQRPRLADVAPFHAFDSGFLSGDVVECLGMAAKHDQDPVPDFENAVADFFAGCFDRFLLALQVSQCFCRTGGIEQCLRLFVAEALEAVPGRIDAGQGFVADLDAFIDPARAVDVGVAGGQILGDADGLRAVDGFLAMGELEQGDGVGQGLFTFRLVAEPVAHFPVADEDFQPRVFQRLAQGLGFRQQGVGLFGLHVDDFGGQAVDQFGAVRLSGVGEVVLELFNPVPNVHVFSLNGGLPQCGGNQCSAISATDAARSARAWLGAFSPCGLRLAIRTLKALSRRAARAAWAGASVMARSRVWMAGLSRLM